MNNTLPKIFIKFSNYLDEMSTFYLKNSEVAKSRGWDNWNEISKEKALEKTKIFRKLWLDKGEEILVSMIKNTGFNFYKNTIDVYITKSVIKTVSDPIIIKSIEKEDRFLSILTHELIHVLIDDFCYIKKIDKKTLLENLRKKFPNENDNVLIHILTHRIHKDVYIDVFKDKSFELIDSDKYFCSKHYNNDYVLSWDYAENIKDLKEFIKEIDLN